MLYGGLWQFRIFETDLQRDLHGRPFQVDEAASAEKAPIEELIRLLKPHLPWKIERAKYKGRPLIPVATTLIFSI